MTKSLLLALLAATAVVVAALPGSAAGDIGLLQNNQVILSCTDGHSVILAVDSATLTNLTQDVAAVNASGTGTTCSLDTSSIDPTSETTEWTVYDYNPSTQEIAPRNSPSKMPATSPDGGLTWQFPFKPGIYSALFTTTDPNVTGNEAGKTLTDTIAVSGDAGTFKTQHGGGDCVGDFPATVRFYFTSPSASGPGFPPPGQPLNGVPPAGFYTQFWWSNPVNLQLDSGNETATIAANMGNPSEWSDWDGQSGANPAVTEAFVEATQNVQSIGLSFGGACFFETGVTPFPDTFMNEMFSSQFSAN
jgi:hypothetical protein